MEFDQNTKKMMHDWVRSFTDHNCIVRVPKGGKMLPGKKEGSYYVSQFYLRNGLFNNKYLNYVGYLFWDTFAKEFKQSPFQIAGIETASTPLIVGLMMTAPAFDVSVNCFSIRKERKQYGLFNRMEGLYNKDIPVMIVDDLCNSNETIDLARKYCEEEGLPLTKDIFTIVNMKQLKTKPALMKSVPYKEGIVSHSLFSIDDFHTNYEEYENLMKKMDINNLVESM